MLPFRSLSRISADRCHIFAGNVHGSIALLALIAGLLGAATPILAVPAAPKPMTGMAIVGHRVRSRATTTAAGRAAAPFPRRRLLHARRPAP